MGRIIEAWSPMTGSRRCMKPDSHVGTVLHYLIMSDRHDNMTFHLGQSIIIREITDYLTCGSRFLKKKCPKFQKWPYFHGITRFHWDYCNNIVLTVYFIVWLS